MAADGPIGYLDGVRLVWEAGSQLHQCSQHILHRDRVEVGFGQNAAQKLDKVLWSGRYWFLAWQQLAVKDLISILSCRTTSELQACKQRRLPKLSFYLAGSLVVLTNVVFSCFLCMANLQTHSVDVWYQQ